MKELKAVKTVVDDGGCVCGKFVPLAHIRVYVVPETEYRELRHIRAEFFTRLAKLEKRCDMIEGFQAIFGEGFSQEDLASFGAKAIKARSKKDCKCSFVSAEIRKFSGEEKGKAK